MNALAQSPVFWVGLITVLALLYILPTLIGIARKVEDLGLLIFVNILPTGVGWIAALVMAFMLPRREPAVYQPARYPVPQYPMAPYPSAQTPPARYSGAS
jgi:drug/metabolite transporter (DMT)-like permease